MKKWLYLLLLVPSLSFAGPYIELGIGSTFGKCDCPRLDNPVGIAAIGYGFKNGIRLDIEHRSSLVQQDYGSNVVSLRYRYEFNKK
jgi:hypothetical protein